MANVTDVWKVTADVEIKGASKAVKELEKQLANVSAGVSLDPKNIEGLKNLQAAMQKIFEDAFTQAQKKSGKSKKDPAKDMTSAFQKIAEGIEAAIQKGFNALKSGDITAVGGMIKGMGKAMGKLSSGLGKVVGAIGGAVGLLGTVVNIFLQMDKHVKDLNKTLLEGGSTAQDMGAGFGEVTDSLNVARKAAQNLKNNMKWGTVAKEQMAILAAFNQAGYLMKEMTKDIEGSRATMKAYQEATGSALKWSKLLGVSTTEMAGQQAKFMEEQGMGLKDINESFSAVYKAADLAGFGTKRFYSMVINATSGMSMYNVRMEEAASLLVSLSKALSPENAQKFLGAITAGYTETGYKDRVKKIMMTGGNTVDKIMERNALLATRNFAKKFEEKLPAIGEAMKDIGLGDIGITGITDPKNQKKAIDAMAQMSQKEIASITAKLKETDPSGLLSREFGKLLDQAKGTTGSLGAQAKALSELGPGGVLAMKLAEGNAKLGPIHERGLVQLMATEEMAGYSGEQLKQMQLISRDMYGSFDNLKKLQERVKNADKTNVEEMKKLQAEQQAATASYGATVDNQGRIVTAINDQGDSVDANGDVIGDEIKDMTDFTMSQAEKFSGMEKEAIDENTLLAREIAQNTTELGKLIEMGVEKWLEQIYNVLFPMAQWVLKKLGVDIRDPREVQKIMKNIRKEIQNRGKVLVEKQAEISNIEKKITEEGDPEARAVLEEQLRVLKENQKGLEFTQAGAQSRLERVQEQAVGGAPEAGAGSRVEQAVYEKFGEKDTNLLVERGNLLRKTLSSEMEKIGVTVYEEGETADGLVKSFQTKVESLLAEGKTMEEALNLAQTDALKDTIGLMKGKAKRGLGGYTEEEYENLGKAESGTKSVAGGISGKVFEGVDKKRKFRGGDLTERSKEVGEEQAKKEFGEKYGEGEVENILLNMSEAEKKAVKDADAQFRARTKLEAKQKALAAQQTADAIEINAKKARVQELLEQTFGVGKIPDQYKDTKNIADAAKIAKKNMTAEEYTEATKTFKLGPVGTPKKDFIYRPGMRPMEFSGADTVIGAQEGGPMEKAFGGGGKGGGGAVSMQFNINGGDPKKVYAVVRKALIDAGVV